ncbi:MULTISPECIES: hypothetical protein [unclassified Saccharibacter]|uniref:hypothetical protein n=1 Tax=unclassified Saccharibacter TaxID=2648722 RepID=UPI00132B967E|nr:MULTISPECIES: hypothetical protein [unclassified Saccharibacter]MXV35816.1 hypothetical protein [Saccharibacter sp. EH611]MXV57937.1 hypothetical protein [Saccharibacter sp. EH70]MXV66332.1 hypothetical protein [Saccharibacter sp. EH60]
MTGWGRLLRVGLVILALPMGNAAARKALHKSPSPEAPSAQDNTSDARPDTIPENGCNRVWLNTKSMIYHPIGSHWYRHTKKGAEMCEKDALKAGARASRARNE